VNVDSRIEYRAGDVVKLLASRPMLYCPRLVSYPPRHRVKSLAQRRRRASSVGVIGPSRNGMARGGAEGRYCRH
jgi:hypothetical protein